LDLKRSGSNRAGRLFDWNLFAQESFSSWSASWSRVRDAGSDQPVVVGQDEGGVANRVLNQFYADAGWPSRSTTPGGVMMRSFGARSPQATGSACVPRRDGDAACVARRRDVASRRADDRRLVERKLALGFAGGSSEPALDWSQDDVFGLKRSDGSSKSWLGMLGDLATFASQASRTRCGSCDGDGDRPAAVAAAFRHEPLRPGGAAAMRAALYHEARAAAYVVVSTSSRSSASRSSSSCLPPGS